MAALIKVYLSGDLFHHRRSIKTTQKKEDYPHYKIEIIYVIADREKIQERLQKREETTGRFVPMEKVEYSFHQIPKTVEALAPLASNVLIINNNEASAKLKISRLFGQSGSTSPEQEHKQKGMQVKCF